MGKENEDKVTNVRDVPMFGLVNQEKKLK